jgi:transcriptional regulator GlxA family with amidase domain
VLAAIRARLGDADFGVTELADAVAQDRSHLFRRVRQVTGLSPSELLRRLRVEEAARLLLTNTGSVADVAFSVGFRSVSHFFRCFNERYGVTPSEYRTSGALRSVNGDGG